MSEQEQSDLGDRADWHRAWRSRKHRILPDFPQLDLSRDQGAGQLVSATLSDNPPEYADRVWREYDDCPVCGQSTNASNRMAASLWLTYERGFSYGMGVWTHVSCFESCPAAGEPPPVPW